MPHPDDRIDEERAAAVWRRAAQLQAEAAQRLEERSRRLAVEGETDPSAPGFRRGDVEAAAVEAGISPEFVQLALAEMEGGERTVGLSGWQERAATRFLGSSRRSIELSRTVSAPPAAVLEAMQRVLPAHPYFLTLRDTVGDDPLDGGVLIFDVSKYDWNGGNSSFTTDAYYADLKQVRIVLRPVAAGPKPACEVVLSADLRRGVRYNWQVGSLLTGFLGSGAAGVGAGLGVGVLGLGGALIALPAVAGGAVVGGATALGYGAAYRWGVRKGVAALEGLLQTLDANARTRGAFALPNPPRPSSDDGGAAMIVSM